MNYPKPPDPPADCPDCERIEMPKADGSVRLLWHRCANHTPDPTPEQMMDRLNRIRRRLEWELMN